jgi:hypothetical protein
MVKQTSHGSQTQISEGGIGDASEIHFDHGQEHVAGAVDHGFDQNRPKD